MFSNTSLSDGCEVIAMVIGQLWPVPSKWELSVQFAEGIFSDREDYDSPLAPVAKALSGLHNSHGKCQW